MRNREKGFSLVEVVITMAILGFVMAAVYASLHSSTSEYEVNNRRAWIVHQARTVLDQISEDLRQATRTSMVPVMVPPNAPAESPATDNISFYKAMPQGYATPVGRSAPETPYYITYMWMPSGTQDATAYNTLRLADGATGIPVTLPGGSKVVNGSTWIDASGRNKPNDLHDNGMLVRIDPNHYDLSNPSAPATISPFPFKVVCNYLQGEPDTTTTGGQKWTPTGFQVKQSVVKAGNESLLQIHLILALQFTDSRNKLQTETLESKVFVRNLQ
jgi:prepilin-type N-terminal cleavage/methylation domain-containing protein